MLRFVVLLVAPAFTTAIFFGGGGGGGGGGGCGCGPPPCPPIPQCPPIQLPQLCLPRLPQPCLPQLPSPCLPSIPTCSSGCGRKKRAAPVELVSGETGVSGKALCNSPILRKFILKNMGAEPAISKAQIHSELKARLPGSHHVVICSQGPFSFVADSEKYCVDGSASQTCYVFQI